jgi:transposase
MAPVEVSPETFVSVWQQGKSAAEVAKKLGLKLAAATQRAGYYRRKGVPLKRFGGRTARLDVTALSKLVQQLTKVPTTK